MEQKQKKCKDCGVCKPVDRKHFGQYKNTSTDGHIKIGYRNSCRECMAKNTSNHSKNNPDMVKLRLQKRKILEQHAKGSYNKWDIQKIRDNLSDKCRFCSVPLNGQGEVEHLTPLSRGGTHYPANLTLTCLKCNREKTNKTCEEYLEWRAERY